ncbi:MAG: nitroreductase family protein [Fusobacteriaceae bacterium]
MDFLSRRSIRKFKTTEIEQEKIDELVKVALTAPSSRNRQPCEFIFVTDKDLLMKISKAKSTGADFIKDSAVSLVIFGDTEKSDVAEVDATIAGTAVMLKAHDIGLGACWVQMNGRTDSEGKSSDEVIRKTFGIPARFVMGPVIVMGYPDEEKNPHTKDEMNFSKIHTNNFSV